MKKFRKHKTKFIRNTILIALFILLTLLSFAWIYQDELNLHFDFLVQTLTTIENAISELASESNVAVILCIAALFFTKCYLPIPLTFLCVISGMVYDTKIAFLINMVCMILQISLKYVEGIVLGGGVAAKVIGIGSEKFLKRLIEFNGAGNPYILFGSRLMPFISLNLISRIYGSMRANYFYYVFISAIGIIPRVYIYSRIGHSLFNPFSREFIILLILGISFLGISGLVCNGYYGNKVNNYEQMLMFIGDKPKYKIVIGESK